jgi:putative oxidoreductase
MADWRTLVAQPRWATRGDIVLLVTRLVIGSFLIWGVWDNIVSAARMAEFVDFVRRHDFPIPEIAARLSVWAQFLCGVGFVTGFAIRWAGLVCAINFAVAVAMVDSNLGVRGALPSTCLILFGLIFATIGGGRFGADAIALKKG